MAQHREPVIEISRTRPSVPLSAGEPLSDAYLVGKTHVVETKQRIWSVETNKIAGTYELLEIPPGHHVLSVHAVILAAFDATVTLQIQDSVPEIYIPAGELVSTTLGATINSAISVAGALTNGKRYAAAATLDAVIGVATATMGRLGIVIYYIDWNKFVPTDWP